MDIPALADVLIKRLCERDKTNDCHITKEAMERLMNYDFPGNVRELLNILQQAVSLSPDSVVTAEHIRLNDHLANNSEHRHPHAAVTAKAISSGARTERDAPLSIAEAEARHIADLLHRNDHNRRVVAAALGITERTLYRKIKRYQINSPQTIME
jgi:DNA-binding NtrC family response regulator